MLSCYTNYLAPMPDITVYMNCDTRLAINLSMFELSEYDAEQITQSRAFCDVFEEAYDICKSAKEVANWQF